MRFKILFILLAIAGVFFPSVAMASSWYCTNQNHPTLGAAARLMGSTFSGTAATYSQITPVGETLITNGTTQNAWAPTVFSSGTTMPAGTWTFVVRGYRQSGHNGGWYPRIKIYDSAMTLIYTTTSPTVINTTSTSGTTVTWQDSVPSFSLGSGNVYYIRIYSYRTRSTNNRRDYLLINRSSSTTNDTHIVDSLSYSPVSRSWRWYDDESIANPTIALAEEDVAPTEIYNQNNIRLRISLGEIGGLSQVGRKRLQFSSDGTNFSDVGEAGSGAAWRYCNYGGTDDALVTALLISSSLNYGPYVRTGVGASTFNHLAFSNPEFDYCIQDNSALVNTTYTFRIYDVARSQPVPADIGLGNVLPSLVVSNHSLNLSVDANFGLAAISMDSAPGPATGTFSNLIVKDYRGSTPGWSVTATGSDFVDGLGNLIAITNLTMTSQTVSPVFAESVSGINLGGGVLSTTTPINLATATSGNGAGNLNVGGIFSLQIPLATVPGTYNSTLTITIS